MTALVVYDSLYGNTSQIADAIASGFGPGTTSHRISELDPQRLPDFDLLVAGSPTQGGRPTKRMQEWLAQIPSLVGRGSASFDTRIDPKASNGVLRVLIGLIGFAAPRISRLLAARGAAAVAPPEGFIVTGKEGPLQEGEYARASAWAQALAASPVATSKGAQPAG